MHHAWEFLEWSCNTLIFLNGGLIAGEYIAIDSSWQQYCTVLLLYVLCMIVRPLVVAMHYPLISRIGLKCSLTDAYFISYAGLRGSLSIALALEVKSSDFISQT